MAQENLSFLRKKTHIYQSCFISETITQHADLCWRIFMCICLLLLLYVSGTSFFAVVHVSMEENCVIQDVHFKHLLLKLVGKSATTTDNLPPTIHPPSLMHFDPVELISLVPSLVMVCEIENFGKFDCIMLQYVIC